MSDSPCRSDAAARSIPRTGARLLRLARLSSLRIRRDIHRLHGRLTLFSGWVWIAAASLVGFEVLEIMLGTFIAAPEFVPVVLIALAGAWYFRRGIRRLWRRVRLWKRRMRSSRARRRRAGSAISRE